MERNMLEISSARKLAGNVFEMKLSGAPLHGPGQFVNLALDGLFLRRPISVCDSEPGSLTLLYKVVGKGTALMAEMKPGERIDVLTGLGRGFNEDMQCSKPLLVGGGIGVAPLYLLARRLLGRGLPVSVILGFNNADEIIYMEEFEALGADVTLDPSDPGHSDRVKELTNGGANAVIEVTGNPLALKQSLACTAKLGRVLLLGCTRTMTEVDFYHDVHQPGIELIGAHSGARPARESHSGFYTEMDDCRVTLDYLSGGRLNFKPMIGEVHSPDDAHEVYSRLAEGKGFPIGVIFKW